METMGHKTGARAEFFKEFEGGLGDGVCALYDSPGSHLRLYCIRYGTGIIILGGGGHKPKTILSLQESEGLKTENYKMRRLSAMISERMKEREIRFSTDYTHLVGNLTLEEDED